MQITIRPDYTKVPESCPYGIRLMVEATAGAPPAAERRPLDIAVALDRSGSMDGEKLDRVKEATRLLVGQLGPGDRFSLTTFDDSVEAVVPPRAMGGGQAEVLRLIDGVAVGGCTDLAGGYEQAARFGRAGADPGTISRVILLTDGLANQGETNPERIAAMAAGLARDGVSTTTIGVGDGYNEELLGRMAEAGHGGTYFIETPDEARAVFGQELGLLSTLAARDLKVRFTPLVQGVKVSQLNSYPEAGGCWSVGDVFGGHPRRLVLELFGKGLPPGGPVEVGTVEARLQVATADGFEARRFEFPVILEPVAESAFSDALRDREVTLEASFLLVARAKADAIALADRSRFDEAAALLEACADAIEALRLDDAALDARLRDLRDRAARLRSEKEAYYDTRARKRLYAESQMVSKSYRMKEEAMMRRRMAREGADPSGGGTGAP